MMGQTDRQTDGRTNQVEVYCAAASFIGNDVSSRRHLDVAEFIARPTPGHQLPVQTSDVTKADVRRPIKIGLMAKVCRKL